MNEFLLLLLPLAAFSGWWLGKDDKKSDRENSNEEYFKALGLLLNDNSEEAIDIFIKIADLDKNALENQIALGNIFRHQGEVDKALHIHTSLLKHKDLTPNLENKLNLSLADDYNKAGILNYAENYYKIDIENITSENRETSMRKLMKIYASQAKWQKSINLATKLDPFKKNKIQREVAHYYCELAKNDIENNNLESAKKHLEQALLSDKKCVRTSIKLGQIAQEEEQFISAIGYFKDVKKQDEIFLLEVLNNLEFCYKKLNQNQEWLDYLVEIEKTGSIAISIRLCDELILANLKDEAVNFLVEKLKSNPNFLLLQFYLNLLNNKEAGSNIGFISEIVEKIVAVTLKYRCKECGFRSDKLIWQCPGCKEWGILAPVSDLTLKESV